VNVVANRACLNRVNAHEPVHYLGFGTFCLLSSSGNSRCHVEESGNEKLDSMSISWLKYLLCFLVKDIN